MATTYQTALGAISGSGLITSVSGITSVINSNPSAGVGNNYYVKDNGSGSFVSAALPTNITFPTTTVTGATQQAVSNNRYSVNNSTAIAVITMPASPAVGDTVEIYGAGLGSAFNFTVAMGTTQTFTGSTGVPSAAAATLTSTQPGAGIRLYASSSGATANWVISTVSGNFSYTA